MCYMHTILLHSHDTILRKVPLEETDTDNIQMCRAPTRKGQTDHYVRWVRVGTPLVEMTKHELKHWLIPHMKGLRDMKVHHAHVQVHDVYSQNMFGVWWKFLWPVTRC